MALDILSDELITRGYIRGMIRAYKKNKDIIRDKYYDNNLGKKFPLINDLIKSEFKHLHSEELFLSIQEAISQKIPFLMGFNGLQKIDTSINDLEGIWNISHIATISTLCFGPPAN